MGSKLFIVVVLVFESESEGDTKEEETVLTSLPCFAATSSPATTKLSPATTLEHFGRTRSRTVSAHPGGVGEPVMCLLSVQTTILIC